MAKMTTKNAKTILFASLTAVMFLSLMMVDDVSAKSDQDPRLERLSELREEYESSTTTKSTDSDLALKRIGLAEEFIRLENNGDADTEDAQKILKKLIATQSGIEYDSVQSTGNVPR